MIRNAEYILIILLFLLACSRKDDSESIQNAETVMTGRVIDQVSKLPVAGAAVYLGALPYALNLITIINLRYDTVTDENGKYKLTVSNKIISYEAIQFMGAIPHIYASKIGFAGSSYCHYLESQKVDVELYHPATLKLRVWNDTISNNIDSFKFALRGMEWFGYPGYIGIWDTYDQPKEIYTCSGRKYDRIFEWPSLWGNMKYIIYNRYPNYGQNSSVVLKPDSTTSLSISF